jgi:hypothetical protein
MLGIKATCREDNVNILEYFNDGRLSGIPYTTVGVFETGNETGYVSTKFKAMVSSHL